MSVVKMYGNFNNNNCGTSGWNNYFNYGNNNFGTYENNSSKFVSLDGIQSGVPTLTTSTLTPTTLRNIEQTFIELTTDPPVAMPYQAGFVPPLAPLTFTDTNDNNSIDSSESISQSSWHTPLLHEENSLATTDSSSIVASINGSPSLPVASSTATAAVSVIPSTASKRSVGGRRPNKASNLSPEEEEKRKVRRERNKLAAARCRKRRVDQTNELVDKVDQLEKEKQNLQKKIEDLQILKEDLQLCLETHITHCRLRLDGRSSPIDIKPKNIIQDSFTVKTIKAEPIDNFVESLDAPPSPKKRIMLASNNQIIIPTLSTIPTVTTILNTPTITRTPPPPPPTTTTITKPNRPSSLNVPLTITPSQALGLGGKSLSDISGVPITTPSSGVMFNFDSLMDGGTGLTPVSAPLLPTTCSSQNKNPLELTTPTSEPSKLVSL